MVVMDSKCSCGENANVFENNEKFCSKCYLKNKGRSNLMLIENKEAKKGSDKI